MTRRTTLEHLARPRTADAGVEVAAVEDRSVQITWRDLPPGRVRVGAGGSAVDVEHPGGPGAAEVTGLPAGRQVVVWVRSGGSVIARRMVRTLFRPPGEELFRFATVNDLHLGRGEDGMHGKLRAVDLEAAHHPYVAARDAVAEAIDWGAELLVVKGDIVDETRDHTWELTAKVFTDVPVPVRMLPGNHDTGLRRHFAPEEGAARHGLVLTRGVEHLDVPGLRVVLMESGLDGNGWGRVARHAREVADLVAGAPGGTGTFVATHHQAQRFRVPLYWPHGIPGPDARSFARTVAGTGRGVLVSSGHTHRNRRRTVGGLTWTEVGATNHFPGVWAGYRVFEGGILQTVRRITSPETLAWTDETRDVLRGVWALWATGTLWDRCFSLRWDR
ncbi:MAG: metallophosphoesterase family protein [Microthrixaceae bacterium]